MHPGFPAAPGLSEPGPRELCAFVSGASAHILRALQPRRTRPPSASPTTGGFYTTRSAGSLPRLKPPPSTWPYPSCLKSASPETTTQKTTSTASIPLSGVACAEAPVEVPHDDGPSLSLAALDTSTLDLFDDILLTPACPLVATEDFCQTPQEASEVISCAPGPGNQRDPTPGQAPRFSSPLPLPRTPTGEVQSLQL